MKIFICSKVKCVYRYQEENERGIGGISALKRLIGKIAKIVYYIANSIFF